MHDSEIVALFLQRSELAIAALDGKYRSLFLGLAKRLLWNIEDAEECVNDTYLGVWNSVPPVKPRNLSAYGCRIVRNLAITRLQANRAQKRSAMAEVSMQELEECIPSGICVEDEMNKKLLTEQIKQFLQLQTAENRVIFMQRYWFLADYAEIGKKTGLSVKNVSVRLTRMRKQLKQYLQKEGVLP